MTTTSIALIAASLLLTFAASAAARPGTPSSVAVSQCPGNDKDPAESLYGKLPKVCVVLTNTAYQRVSFDVGFAINGVPSDVQPVKNQVDCFDSRTIGCIPGFNLGDTLPHSHRTATVRRGDPIPPEGFFIRDLAFDTKYCFRFRARDEDGYVSELWTQWSCVQTKPQPKVPEAPSVSVQFVPAGWSSEKRTYQHDHIVMSWATPSEEVSGFTVSSSSPDATYGKEIPSIVQGHFHAGMRSAEFVLPPMSKNGRAPDVRVVVCAENYSGKRCSRPVSARPVSAAVDMAREGSGSSFGSSARKTPAETAPVAAAVPVPPSPAVKAAAQTAGVATVRRSPPPQTRATAQTSVVAPASAPPPKGAINRHSVTNSAVTRQ
jgi:hypothetical protein